MKFKGKIIVKLKSSIKDVRGITIEEAVKSSFQCEIKIRTGSFYEFSFEAENKTQAEKRVKMITEELLCNPITEVSEILWEE